MDARTRWLVFECPDSWRRADPTCPLIGQLDGLEEQPLSPASPQQCLLPNFRFLPSFNVQVCSGLRRDRFS